MSDVTYRDGAWFCNACGGRINLGACACDGALNRDEEDA